MTDQTPPQQQRETPMANIGQRRAVLPVIALEQGYGWRFTGFRIPLVLNPVRAPLPPPAPPIQPILPILANIGIHRAPRILRRRRRRLARRRLRRLLPRPLAPWVSL
ncbi:hypothetical protein EYC84_007518 [Monilinia fructicola]|uniref:Uncharacterized protein n=1 Tax=Monilinia fructicola TaxID=38448 RepID=A0A5M9JID5_MONFR|nr:hypothetical protein EYC84_007518 [Monilinia fructicola]